jgi:hypothetical protein
VTSIPLADAPALRVPGRVTAAMRVAFAAAAVVALAVFLLVSRHPHTQTVVPLSSHADTVLVLDLSASISSDTFSRIGGTLAALSRSGKHFGLVVFSDSAYEALPPGTPAADLAPLVRYFTLRQSKVQGVPPSFPPNPWQTTFSGGTRISAGMDLGHRIALSGARHSTVVLISDLDDDPRDLTRLVTVLLSYRRDGIPVRIVGLNPSPADSAFFRRLIRPSPVIVQAPTLYQALPDDRTPFPWTLIALACLAGAALAGRELWAPRLDWRRT